MIANDLILDVTKKFEEKIEERSITKTEIAHRMGIPGSNVTDFLSGKRNMTLRTIQRLSNALDMKAVFTLVPNNE